MDRTREDRAMARALELARRGPRSTNPQVGAVLLSPDGETLAEGWHRGSGTAHAEVDALSKLAPGAARGATAVVTLEPCNHTGRTGPCAVALLEAGVARVVYAMDDPGHASGGGARRLREGGVDVESGIRGDDARELIADWLTVQRLGRPHVTVKWAQSLDGRAAAQDGTSQWITGPEARADVHTRRASADAIVAGIGTILADDAALTARLPDGSLAEHQPVPVVLGRRAIPADAAVRRHPLPLFAHPGRDLSALLDDLRDRGIQRVFVEGGPVVASAFLRVGLADDVVTYIAPLLLGGPKTAIADIGVTTIAEGHRLSIAQLERLGDDILLISRRPEEQTDSEAESGPENDTARPHEREI